MTHGCASQEAVNNEVSSFPRSPSATEWVKVFSIQNTGSISVSATIRESVSCLKTQSLSIFQFRPSLCLRACIAGGLRKRESASAGRTPRHRWATQQVLPPPSFRAAVYPASATRAARKRARLTVPKCPARRLRGGRTVKHLAWVQPASHLSHRDLGQHTEIRKSVQTQTLRAPPESHSI